MVNNMITMLIIMDDGEVEERFVLPAYIDAETGEIYSPDRIDWDAMDADRPSWVWGSF